MNNTLTTPALKYRLFELIVQAGKSTTGVLAIKREIRHQTGVQLETLQRWINFPADSTQSPISLENAVIIAKILKCKSEDLLAPPQVELFANTQKRVA